MNPWLRLAVLGISLAAPPSAMAAFHLYRIEELFSDATGTVQYIVLHETTGTNGENLWAGHSITATSQGNTKSFAFPTNLPRSTTANTRVLIATQGFAQLNLVTPDFVVPNGFLPLTGGTVNYAGVDQVSYPVLPTDGTSALSRSGSTTPNVATNFSGQTASVTAAVPPVIATNYQGLWWAAPADSESGWGLNLAQQEDTIFATWFTYDATGKAWWLSMTAGKIAPGAYSGTLMQTGGPPFSAVPFDPAMVTRTVVGTGTLTFTDANTGSFSYTVNEIQQVKPITRQQFGVLPTCVYGPNPDFAAATNYQDLWWVPGGAESGWGINLTHQGSTIFATWFTYDVDGSPMWLSGTLTPVADPPPPPDPMPPNPGYPYGAAIAANVTPAYSGNLLRTRGPAFSAVPFNSANVTRSDVGSATITFASGNAATLAYTVNGVTQTKPLTRQLFTPPAGTLCQ